MELQFPDVELARPHYESVYCVLSHPTRSQALWVRTTVQKRPGELPTGALWVTWFSEDGVRAGKLNALEVAPGGRGITCGPATQGLSGSGGALRMEGIDASWDLTFRARTPALAHLHLEALYRAPVPRTKSTSPIPNFDVSGSLEVNGQTIDLTGWTGMLGHNWGTEHAARWVWLRATDLGEDGTGWIDAVLGRVKVGRALTPWVGFGAIELDGARHPLGGMLRGGTTVTLRPWGAELTLAGRGISVAVNATVDRSRTVGWGYADPAGVHHEVVNSSVAGLSVTVRQKGQVKDPIAGRRRTYTPMRRGVLEVGGDTRGFDVPLQPYVD